MNVKTLLNGITVLSSTAEENMEITGISHDSRTTQKGDVFVAMTGYETDGHRFIPMAVEKGASLVICEKEPTVEIPYILVENSRKVLAEVAANFYDHPEKKLTMVAVTGTNGKTSITYLLKAILEKTRHTKVGLIGTNQNMIGEEVFHTERTTPESSALYALFARMVQEGCTHVVMETSSHALELFRVHGITFTVGIFTNLTQDHLDFHKTMENYCDAKSILFRNCKVGVYNSDDPWSHRLMEKATCEKRSYGEKSGDVQAKNVSLTAAGIAFTLMDGDTSTEISLAIPGGFMVYNTLAVLCAAKALGISYEESAAVLKTAAHIKGRVEVVPTDGDYTILIDYAHTPDALQNVLETVKGFARGRTVVLFGCGGDRDKTKRPKMGAIAARLADFVIFTSDNPRTEDPGAILKDVVSGVPEDCTTPYVVVENRIEAIHYAIDHAQKDDVIVLAGKGHEDYQIIGKTKYHLDEREVVAEYLKTKR